MAYPIVTVDRIAQVYADVLTAKQCKQLIELSTDKLKRSSVVNETTTDIEDTRTSKHCFLDNSIHLVATIQQHLSTLTGNRVESCEPMQILRYDVGDQYTPHYDFYLNTPAGRAAIAKYGQRYATMVIYLTDCEKGGSTHFPQLKIAVHCKAKYGVYFWYPNQELASEHASLPVIEGTKWAATQWWVVR